MIRNRKSQDQIVVSGSGIVVSGSETIVSESGIIVSGSGIVVSGIFCGHQITSDLGESPAGADDDPVLVNLHHLDTVTQRDDLALD